MNKSLDPRMNRIELIENEVQLPEMDNWETWEVFHQKKRGDQHIHVGIVHAPNADMALVMAKEAYGRRGITANLWVVKSSHIHATEYSDIDMFETTPEKQYREAGGYKVMEKINKYKKENPKV